MKMLSLALALTCSAAIADPGLWYQPERDGHGLSISQPTEGGHAVVWYLYTRDRLPTFVIGEPCQAFPCMTPLYAPTANWLGGDFSAHGPIGSLELRPDGDSLKITFDLSGLSPELCDTGIGGLLLNECVGTLTLTRLAD